ncbi:MAG: Flp pilus assembly protein CpaB [Planctomycetaceae bacterium]
MKMLTPARVTLLMLLVVGGLVAAYVAKNLLAADSTPPKIETRTVPMAVADLTPGTTVTEAHLGVGRMDVREFSRHPGMLLDNRAIVGRVVKEPVQAGTPILSSQLYQPGEQPPLSVGDGMRAVSVALKDPVALVDGRIRPGQFVDVHLTPTNTGANDRFPGGITLTLFKGVRVLALGTGGGTLGSDRSSSVTLELTPGQSNIMILAASRGDITLGYNPDGKGDGGVGVNREDRATLEDILGLKPPVKDGSTFTSESYRGSTRSINQFRDGRRIIDGGGITRRRSNGRGDRSQPPADIATPTPRPQQRPRTATGPVFGPKT